MCLTTQQKLRVVQLTPKAKIPNITIIFIVVYILHGLNRHPSIAKGIYIYDGLDHYKRPSLPFRLVATIF